MKCHAEFCEKAKPNSGISLQACTSVAASLTQKQGLILRKSKQNDSFNPLFLTSNQMVMNRYWYKFFWALCIFVAVSACEVEEVVDPNNPTLASVLNNATSPQLQTLVTGLEARNRLFITNAVQMFGVFGREIFFYNASDPRFAREWLGVTVKETYPDFFGSAGTYSSPYQAVKQANILIDAANASNNVTAEQKRGYAGFAKTIKGFQMLWPLMQQYQNGIRIDVTDPLKPGPIVPFNDALAFIRKTLDEGFADLQAAGATFNFRLTMGFATPAQMARVNRAIAARAAIYANDGAGALTALQGSFMDQNVTAATAAKMNDGPLLTFGEAPDVNNPLFYPFDVATQTIVIAHPDWIEDAAPGDLRLGKVARRIANQVISSDIRDRNQSPIPGIYQDARWRTNTTAIPFIRNEELILIFAEAQARQNNAAEAVRAINLVRNAWGLANYAGTTTLVQRRYSLWAEGGHRWIDLRRTNRLNATNVDLRDGGTIFTQVSKRQSEITWDAR
jgi:starch-binding outer membrane protein, SusD/RagB family